MVQGEETYFVAVWKTDRLRKRSANSIPWWKGHIIWLDLLIPDCNVVLVPTIPDLEIVVLGDKLKDCLVGREVSQGRVRGLLGCAEGSLLTVGLDNVAFTLRHVIDPTGVDLMTGAKEGLPARDWIGANHRAERDGQQLDLLD
jgi:hypothetical protein